MEIIIPIIAAIIGATAALTVGRFNVRNEQRKTLERTSDAAITALVDTNLVLRDLKGLLEYPAEVYQDAEGQKVDARGEISSIKSDAKHVERQLLMVRQMHPNPAIRHKSADLAGTVSYCVLLLDQYNENRKEMAEKCAEAEALIDEITHRLRIDRRRVDPSYQASVSAPKAD